MKRLIVDLDETLTLFSGGGGAAVGAAGDGAAGDGGNSGGDYSQATPNLPLIEKLRQYQTQGFEIVIHTSRNMRTFSGNLGQINLHTLPVALEWLRQHNVPFDEIYVAKPWCGHDGFYIDDRAVRPSEFLNLSYAELLALIAAERARV